MTNKLASALLRASRALQRAALALAPELQGKTSLLTGSTALDEYVAGPPSVQNAVDALAGWNMAIPGGSAAKAGVPVFFDDPRIYWALERFGPIKGRNVLELGPLEASHTYMLERGEPASLLAIEGNRLSFLRCLVVKEISGLKTAKFELGDFVPWLETTEQRFDLIVASGVLYHMANPVRLLELIAARTDAVYLWTHYASDAAMPEGDPRRLAMIGDVEIVESHGVKVRCYRRSYWGAWNDKSFCGGPHDIHRWIEISDMLSLLHALGFDDIGTAHDEQDHKNGPSMSIFARRTATPATPG